MKLLADDRRFFCAKNLEEKIDFIVESIKEVNRQAYIVYKPIVDEICSGRAVEGKEFENVLDGLLSVCISDKMLDLFKQVGRRFYNQYPEIITDYVMFYKEMYGEEEG